MWGTHSPSRQAPGTPPVVLRSCLKPGAENNGAKFPTGKIHLWGCPTPPGPAENARRTLPPTNRPSTSLLSPGDKVGRKEGAFLKLRFSLKAALCPTYPLFWKLEECVFLPSDQEDNLEIPVGFATEMTPLTPFCRIWTVPVG